MAVHTHLITCRAAIPVMLRTAASDGTRGLVVEMTDGTSQANAEFRRNVGFYYDLVKAGGAFTLRAEIRPDRLRIEVEDAGGPWRDGPRDDGRPHGFDVVTAIAGPGKWGINGDARGRTASATLDG